MLTYLLVHLLWVQIVSLGIKLGHYRARKLLVEKECFKKYIQKRSVFSWWPKRELFAITPANQIEPEIKGDSLLHRDLLYVFKQFLFFTLVVQLTVVNSTFNRLLTEKKPSLIPSHWAVFNEILYQMTLGESIDYICLDVFVGSGLGEVLTFALTDFSSFLIIGKNLFTSSFELQISCKFLKFSLTFL